MIYTSRSIVVYSLRSFTNFVYTTSKHRRPHTQLAKFTFKLARRVLECVIRYCFLLNRLFFFGTMARLDKKKKSVTRIPSKYDEILLSIYANNI